MTAVMKTLHRVVCCGAVSYLAPSVHAASNAHAQQVTLPPVTVETQRRPVRRAQPTRSAPRPATTPQVAAPPQPLVPYLTPVTGTLGSPPAPYAGGQVATGGQLGLLGNRGV